MVRKKIDNRIRDLIECGTQSGHRTMFVVVGEKGRDQVAILHQMLSKATVKARPSVLWCYKKELGFSSHRMKRIKQVHKKMKGGKVNTDEDDPLHVFIGSTDIRYCYYSETQKILGNTYGMCVLQDFEALTPNLLARTIETVEGGGLIIVLLLSITSLKQLYTMTMDVHDRYRTEAHSEVIGRFNERFLLSLSSCSRCLVVDDNLTVLPISSHILELTALSKKVVSNSDIELNGLKEAFSDTQPLCSLINCCKTLDQAKALLKFVDAISEKTLRSTVSITASRGRGKSAALGLAVTAAIAFGYANIFVTSPSPENLKTFFEFVFKGFDAIGYKEHLDYGLVQSTNPEYNKALIRVNVFKDNRQTIQYIHPTDANKLSQAELLVIDEAAAIPLPYVKAMLGPYLIFLSSTINGYEGTGRSLSLKLLQQLRQQSNSSTVNAIDSKSTQVLGRTLQEVALEESIRYKPGDAVEKWLTDLLCLDTINVESISSGTPPPNECDLYYINRDTLFCYHKASEAFLQRLVAIFVASHYKNSPNDLQMMSDAPAHHLFCLLGPTTVIGQNQIPEILCAIQVCLEGCISNSSVTDVLKRGKRAAGDLIPWTMAQHFQDKEFPSLSGARIVRIATHPDYQNMGYGSRALTLLRNYYCFKIPSLVNEWAVSRENPIVDLKSDILTEQIVPREKLPPLLIKLSERPPEKLNYLGVAYGLTLPLLKFWKNSGFVPVYIRQTVNELTGENSCIMLSSLHQDNWLPQFWEDFRRRLVSLFSYQFKTFPTSLALSLVVSNNVGESKESVTKKELDYYFTKYDIKRIELYCSNLVDYHLIMDLMPSIAKLFFLNKMGETTLSALQRAILLGMGLQHKTIDILCNELELPASQLLGLFNRTIRKIFQFIMEVTEVAIEESLGIGNLIPSTGDLCPLEQSMTEELESADVEMKLKQKKELKKLKKDALSEFAVKGSDHDWKKALQSNDTSIVTVKSGFKRPVETKDIESKPISVTKKKKMKKKGNKKLL